jgi:DNA-directed RNA polymerase subunit K/omega
MTTHLAYDELFEQALIKVKNNRFLLSILLAKRVAQLRKGSEPLVHAEEFDTHEAIVCREIVGEKLEWRVAESEPLEGDMDHDFAEGEPDGGE